MSGGCCKSERTDMVWGGWRAADYGFSSPACFTCRRVCVCVAVQPLHVLHMRFGLVEADKDRISPPENVGRPGGVGWGGGSGEGLGCK